MPVAWVAGAGELLTWLANHVAHSAVPAHLSRLHAAGNTLDAIGSGVCNGRADPGIRIKARVFRHARADTRFLARLVPRLPRLCELAAGGGARDVLHGAVNPAPDPNPVSASAVHPGMEATAAELVSLVGLCGPAGAGAAALGSLCRLACAPGQAPERRARAEVQLHQQGAVLVGGAPRPFSQK